MKKQKREYKRWPVPSDKTKLERFPVYLLDKLRKIARFLDENKDKNPKVEIKIDE
jgi:hypothetical protein